MERPEQTTERKNGAAFAVSLVFLILGWCFVTFGVGVATGQPVVVWAISIGALGIIIGTVLAWIVVDEQREEDRKAAVSAVSARTQKKG